MGKKGNGREWLIGGFTLGVGEEGECGNWRACWGLPSGPSLGVSISFKAIWGCVLGSDYGVIRVAIEPSMTNYDIFFGVIPPCRLRNSQHRIPTRTLTLCAHSTLLTQAVFSLVFSLHLVDQRLVSSGGVHDAEPRVAEAVAGSAVVADLVGAAVVQPLREQLRQGLDLRSGEVGVEQRKDAAHGAESFAVGGLGGLEEAGSVSFQHTHTRAHTHTLR